MVSGHLLLIDNYDSFTHTIADYLRVENQEVLVKSRDAIREQDLTAAKGIVLSPGPGNPATMPDLLSILKNIPESRPVLGICLGFQALGVLEGLELRSGAPVHGKISEVFQSGSPSWLLNSVPSQFSVVRYHSLYFTECPAGWEPILWTGNKILMAMERKDRVWAAVQYHPEAFLSEHGRKIFQNWLEKAGFSRG